MKMYVFGDDTLYASNQIDDIIVFIVVIIAYVHLLDMALANDKVSSFLYREL